MKKLLRLSLLLVAVVSCHAFAALPQSIRFATEASYPPFEFTDEFGQVKGFDIDIARALCTQMKVQCTFSNQPWESLIPGLKWGKFDALIGAIGITAEREQHVDFTMPYYSVTAVFVAVKDSDFTFSPKGLRGKEVGVQSGTTFEQYLKEEYPHANVKTYATQQDLFLDLVDGRVDLVLVDGPLSQQWLKEGGHGGKYAVIGMPAANWEYFGPGYGIAVKQGNVELAAAFNKALADIKAFGIYDRIVKQYFGR